MRYSSIAETAGFFVLTRIWISDHSQSCCRYVAQEQAPRSSSRSFAHILRRKEPVRCQRSTEMGGWADTRVSDCVPFVGLLQASANPDAIIICRLIWLYYPSGYILHSFPHCWLVVIDRVCRTLPERGAPDSTSTSQSSSSGYASSPTTSISSQPSGKALGSSWWFISSSSKMPAKQVRRYHRLHGLRCLPSATKTSPPKAACIVFVFVARSAL